jgi:Ca-activated chloride channel family protein
MTEKAASAKQVQREASRKFSKLYNTRARIARHKSVAYRCLIALIGLFVTQFVAGAQVSQPAQSRSDGEYTIKLNADMVILSATVLDSHNALVSGLGKDNFEVYEDGVAQQIKYFSHEDIPVTVGILVDNSGSMGPKRDDVIAAAMDFARSSNPQDQMFVVNFNDRVSFGLPADKPFTDRQDQLQMALSAIRTIGQTSLYDGIAAGLDHLKEGNRDKKVLILISDGGDNVSRHSLTQVIGMAKQSTAIIYAIGIFDEHDGDRNPGVLKRFAKETGGVAFFPESLKDIGPICELIARDIRNQYTLTYVPKVASQDGRYRTIQVTARAPGYGRLSVRTRTGYSVPLIFPTTASETTSHDTRN